MELLPKNKRAAVAVKPIGIEGAFLKELILRPEECESQSKAAFVTAEITAQTIAMLIDRLHAAKFLTDDDVLAMLPSFEQTPPFDME